MPRGRARRGGAHVSHVPSVAVHLGFLRAVSQDMMAIDSIGGVWGQRRDPALEVIDVGAVAMVQGLCGAEEGKGCQSASTVMT